MFKLVLAFAVTIGLVSARCPNDCSGHGTCSAGSVCQCRRNFHGNDCSQRLCYEGLAFIDLPQGDINANSQIDINMQSHYQNQNNLINEKYPLNYGLARTKNTDQWNEGHFYAPCSNRGKCDKTTGLCTCFPGFEGEGCVRTSCPNKCSGHGQCVLIDVNADVVSETYDSWDAQKTQKCECDPGYTGPNCNLKKCVEGVDPIKNLYTNTDSVYKIEWKKNTLTNEAAMNGNIHFTISYDDDFGETWTTTAMTLQYNAGTPQHMLGTPSTTDFAADSYVESYIAEQVNASLHALPERVISNPYVWSVQVSSSAIVHAYPYPNIGITSFTQAALETAAAAAIPTDKKKHTATGKSIYVNDKSYRMPLWTANAASPNVNKAFNCAANSLCIFIKINEPRGNKKMVVNYKYTSTQASGGENTAEQRGVDSASSSVVTVTEVGSDRQWSTTLDGSPTIAYDSTANLHTCSKRGLCDYTTGVCKCFTGYSGFNCGKRNSLGTA